TPVGRVYEFFICTALVAPRRLRSQDLIRKVRAGEWTDDDAVFGRGASCADGWATRRSLYRSHRRDAGETATVFRLDHEHRSIVRKFFIAILVLLILGSAAAYIVFRLTRKPPPTPRAWRAQVTTVHGDGSPTMLADPFGVAVGDEGV